MITRDSIETAYSILHQKRRSSSARLLLKGRKNVYIHSTLDWQKEDIAKQIDIEAQEYAKGFYESVGFRQSSDTFMLDGIPHIKMTWTINSVQ